ncbi:hypothetical protein [Actinorugispora endophytica]|uniref:hypothetical protein n=1 Tax=Actinorugispora endophytica TaxID=1605990 RepID=UPI001FB615E2|nr:hypothetical protein [Actinorugispora endophytica]
MSDSVGARLTRFAARSLFVLAAGVMAGGFLGWRAGLLVAALVALSHPLLAVLGPRLRAPYGRGRLLRALHRNGYHVIPDGHSRHLAVGPGGVYLLETRVWQHAVSWNGDDWMVGNRPAAHVVERLGSHAARLEHLLHLAEDWPGISVVPVVMVAGRLPEPVMRAGRTIIARPRSAVGHVLAQPTVLDPREVDGVAERIDHLVR